MTPYTFERHNRTPRTIVILICVYIVLAALHVLLDAAWWLIGLFGLATLPALWDVVHATRAGLTLDADRIAWFSGRRAADIRLSEVDYVRFDTRWDFSVRASVVLTSGKKIRLPEEATPPHHEFEVILQKAGLRTERHHFNVL